MKITKLLIIGLLLNFCVGCATVKTTIKNHPEVTNAVLTKSVDVILDQAKLTKDQLAKIKVYLVACKTLNINIQAPNLDEAKKLIDKYIPQQYTLVVNGIMDVVESYIKVQVDKGVDIQKIFYSVLDIVISEVDKKINA
jgi:hypothetical protein